MTKRPFDDSDGEPNLQDSLTNGPNESLLRSIILSQMSRVVLGRYSKNLKIRKEHIQAVLQKHNLKSVSKVWLQLLDKEMREVFGMKVETDELEIILTSNLDSASKDILHDLWACTSPQEKMTNLMNPSGLMPRQKRQPVIVNTIEELQGGLVMIILSLIVLSGNKMNESDLMQALKNFGFTENLNESVPVLNKNTPSILSDLTRKKYLKKSLPHGDTPVGAEYSFGKRASIEFPPQKILNFMLEVMDSEEGQQKAQTAVMRCFPEFRTENTESGAADRTD